MPKISFKSLIKSKKTFISIFFTIFLIVCLIIANFLSVMLVKTSNTSENVSSTSFELYMLTLASSQVEKEAESLAVDYQTIGAGGFIWQKDNYFYVVSSVYANKNDAILVQNSVKANQGLDSEIITVSFDSITISGSFSSEEKKVLYKALNSCYDYYLSIYDIAISLDTSVYNEISARLAVNSAHNNLSYIIDNFNTLFENTNELSDLKNMLQSIFDVSKLLCGGTLLSNNQTYSSLLKYRYTEALNILFEFIQN